MPEITNIPEVFKNNDTVYHYTTTETALNFILRDKKIRLSPRNSSIDPIENLEDWHSFSDNGYKESSAEAKEKANKVKDLFKQRLSKTTQVCFCKNNELKDEDKMVHLPIEKYGFLKPRMWDNYADKYKGVCLAFSREELEKKAVKNNIIFDNLNYISYSKISKSHNSIDVKQVNSIGVETYYKQNLERENKRLFNKHLDYTAENEFRLCSFSDNTYDYLDISKALKGVFISNLGVNQHLLKAFRQVTPSNILNENMFTLNWKKNGVTITSFKEHFEHDADIARSLKILMSEQTKPL
jgi:hypothetical protein